MSRLSAEVELTWGPGDYTFALKAAQIEELEHLCKKGIGRICMSVFSQIDYDWTTLRETIRLGLIGGGTPPVEANRLVKTYVDGQPIDAKDDPSSTLKTATAVLKAVHFGWSELPEVQSSGETQAATDESTGVSTAPRSSKRGSTRSQSARTASTS